MQSNKILFRIILALLFLIVFVLGLKSFREPDLWWMLRTGEWIAENSRALSEDVFSYTFAGTEWINVKWGFELLIYICASLGGDSFIYLLQSLVNVLILYFLLKNIRLIQKLQGKTSELWKNNSTIILLVLFIALFSIEYRMIGRPEMTSHLMCLVFLYQYLSYRINPGKSIYWLILFQVLWTNLHEAYGTGIIILLVFITASLAEFYFRKSISGTKEKFPKHLVIASILAIAAVSINPYGIRMIWHPFEILSQVYENKYTMELHSFRTSYFWNQKEAWLLIFFLISIVVFFRPKDKNRYWYYRPLYNYGMPVLVLYVLFLYLALTAHRNIVYFILLFAPFTASELSRMQFLQFKKAQVLHYLFIGLLVFSYIQIVNNNYYRKINKHDRYGLQVYAERNPVGAAKFIQENNLSGTCFSDYLTSSYLLWHLRPEFKTFIDLRDLDIFSPEFFQLFARMIYIPLEFEKADKKYQFRYIVLYRPDFHNLHKYLYHSKNWQFAYADPVAVIYTRSDSASASTEKDFFHDLAYISPSDPSLFISTLFNPFFDQKENRDAYNIDLIAADYYYTVADYEKALKRAQKALGKRKYQYQAHEKSAYIYLSMADQADDDSLKNISIKQAYDHFTIGIQVNKEKDACYKGLGILYMFSGDMNNAKMFFEKAIHRNKKDAQSYYYLGQCVQSLMHQYPHKQKEYYDLWFSSMERSLKLNPAQEMLRLQLALAYCEKNACKKARKHLRKMGYIPHISQKDKETLEFCKAQCDME
jgi:hypothetical protein